MRSATGGHGGQQALPRLLCYCPAHRPAREEVYRLTTDSDELTNLAGPPAYDRMWAELSARFKELRVHYSGVASGFP